MRRVFSLSLGLAFGLALLAGDASAKSRKPAPAQNSGYSVPLPKDLTTNKDWLDDGAGNPASGTLQPNKHANDNYFLEQQQFWRNDPTRNTEAGQLFDGFN